MCLKPLVGRTRVPVSGLAADTETMGLEDYNRRKPGRMVTTVTGKESTPNPWDLSNEGDRPGPGQDLTSLTPGFSSSSDTDPHLLQKFNS